MWKLRAQWRMIRVRRVCCKGCKLQGQRVPFGRTTHSLCCARNPKHCMLSNIYLKANVRCIKTHLQCNNNETWPNHADFFAYIFCHKRSFFFLCLIFNFEFLTPPPLHCTTAIRLQKLSHELKLHNCKNISRTSFWRTLVFNSGNMFCFCNKAFINERLFNKTQLITKVCL